MSTSHFAASDDSDNLTQNRRPRLTFSGLRHDELDRSLVEDGRGAVHAREDGVVLDVDVVHSEAAARHALPHHHLVAARQSRWRAQVTLHFREIRVRAFSLLLDN